MRYDAMCTAIAACEQVDEVKEIRDRARAFECYAKQALNIEAERKAGEIRLRAERRAGQLLTEMKQKGERQDRGGNRKMSERATSTLPELGVTRDQSSQWQQLAKLPEAAFEAELTKPGPKPTAQGLLYKLSPPATPKPLHIDPQALDAWGWMDNFTLRQLGETSPRKLFAGMTEPMQEDVIRLAPQLIAWLRQFGETTDGTHRKNQ
jgi:hypothetical protein